MRARAQARGVPMTPQKVRRVVDLVRGLPVEEAQTLLRFQPQAASEPIAKVLASAIANAEHNEGLDPETLWVKRAYVDEGPARFLGRGRLRPRAQGRRDIIPRYTSHITVIVESRPGAGKAGGRRGAGTARTRRAA